MRPAVPLVLTLALAGCGAERTAAPSFERPVTPSGRTDLPFAQAGLRLALPDGWLRTTGQAPLLVTTSSGPATVSVWRYPRTEPLPADDLALESARTTLLAAAKARDPTFEQTSVETRDIAGQRAIEVRGTATVDGRARTVRSVHVFAFGAELVVDALAPARDAKALDRDVVDPLLASLRLEQPT